ncbi:MAG: hypothetical protein KDB53_20910 [Planctomycetes bacterium]|nr:hypothetical protein [Planctomycetota bacterium]
MLFLGTELGLWISLDGGEHWQRFRHGVPTASVMDLAIQARDADLVVGTHGRGVFLIEDLRPLRAMANGDWDSNLRLFAPPTAYQARFGRPASTRFGGATEFAAPNRVRGARISAWFPDEALPLPSETTDDDTTAVLRIEDSEGRPVRRLVIKPHRGLFRFTWDLREARPTGPGEEKPKDVASDLAGPRVIPGRYRLILEYQDQRAESSVEVAGDPRAESDAAVLASRLAKLRRINVLEHALGRGLDRIREHRDDLAYLRKRLPDESDENREKLESLRDAIKSADESLRELEGQVRATDDEKGITSRDRISSRLRRVQGAIESHDGPVTVDQAEAALRGETDVREFLDELALVEERDLPPVRSAAAELNVVLLPTKDTLTIQ